MAKFLVHLSTDNVYVDAENAELAGIAAVGHRGGSVLGIEALTDADVAALEAKAAKREAGEPDDDTADATAESAPAAPATDAQPSADAQAPA